MLSDLMQKDSKLLVLLTRRRLQAFCGSRLAAGCLGRWRCWLQQFFWYALHNTAQHQQLHSSDLTDQLSKVSVLCFTQKKIIHSASEVTTLWRYTNLFIIIKKHKPTWQQNNYASKRKCNET